MQIKIDLSIVPPEVTLLDPENFKEFSVEVKSADHAWVDPSTVESLAGELAQEPAWQQGLKDMLKYASSQGGVDHTGAVRAHITNGDNLQTNQAASV